MGLFQTELQYFLLVDGWPHANARVTLTLTSSPWPWPRCSVMYVHTENEVSIGLDTAFES